MRRIVRAAPAIQDLRRIEKWLGEKRSAEVAARTLTRIGQRADQPETFAALGRRERGDVRTLVVYDRPYPILDRIDSAVVDVLRPRHAREDWRAQP
ncbi:hypothetical protein COC42_02495 [Sphingomonas spermidinifaciens]|uniref:Type II toxin-antitoxin system RelE/ParE family toxin n=1 Tax=Sphingomonas spermidinifaciens TaxID=1141889 RepID=A0A2A4B6N1_9SPHN|nr:type II toxin-antitoxin system RelE/ParE family toxin [Sphingomonas spermidinifaciens]PCD03294.1 hypothetical protein COC42_02495 [Sphingomonas spermidinifaciens]